jgi:hypothetical protein
MALIGMFEAYIAGAVISVAGIGAGIGLSTAGTAYLAKASQKFANKEQSYPKNSKQALICRIAHWASLALSGLTGASGAALVGFSTFCAIQILSLGTLTTVAIAAGVVSALAMEILAIKLQLQKNCFQNFC